jgi:hypothetical protein
MGIYATSHEAVSVVLEEIRHVYRMKVRPHLTMSTARLICHRSITQALGSPSSPASATCIIFSKASFRNVAAIKKRQL